MFFFSTMWQVSWRVLALSHFSVAPSPMPSQSLPSNDTYGVHLHDVPIFNSSALPNSSPQFPMPSGPISKDIAHYVPENEVMLILSPCEKFLENILANASVYANITSDMHLSSSDVPTNMASTSTNVHFMLKGMRLVLSNLKHLWDYSYWTSFL